MAPRQDPRPWVEDVVLAEGCSTTPLLPLSQQIIAEAACSFGASLEKLGEEPNLSMGDAVFPFMQREAVRALTSALAQRRDRPMTVNSMLRTAVQQYALYRWYKASLCGISLAADPGSSNHESGLAVDIREHQTWKPLLEPRGFHWLGPKDPPHFEYRASEMPDQRAVFLAAFQRLWNRNHPEDRIEETGTWNPQTEARVRAAPANGFARTAECAHSPL